MANNKLWRIWAKSLGEKSGANNREADYIALVRTIVVGLNFITCLFIIAGVIHNWQTVEVLTDGKKRQKRSTGIL